MKESDKIYEAVRGDTINSIVEREGLTPKQARAFLSMLSVALEGFPVGDKLFEVGAISATIGEIRKYM